MAQSSRKLPQRKPAIWQRWLAFGVLVAGVVLAAGCGQQSPTAPSSGDASLALDKGDTRIATSDMNATALLSVTVPDFDRWLCEGTDEYHWVIVIPGQEVQFFWREIGGVPLGPQTTFRYGWNIQDFADDNDPGWVCRRGTGARYQQTKVMAFWDGLHDLTIERWDGDQLLVRATFGVWVAPMLAREAPAVRN